MLIQHSNRKVCFLGAIVTGGAMLLAVEPIQTDTNALAMTDSELTRFLSIGPEFLKWVKETGRNDVIATIAQNPAALEGKSDAVQRIHALGWEPMRFAFVLNHLMVGYQSLDAEPPQTLIDRLVKSRSKALANPVLADAERKAWVRKIDGFIAEARERERKLDAISCSEKLLMWQRRKEIRDAFKGCIPLHKMELPRP